ncbi:MAG: ABC transporter ATP-binding protein [Bacteriovoracaceae bacterium]|jgi:dipeptide transport system ATP-binding protein|nr:ABC transporter ATP-binding protein [Bacteriovoracaceae bacterium]
MTKPLLEVKNLNLFFKTSQGRVQVLENINFSLKRGECLGIVGESGCGKSMSSLSIMQLLPGTAELKADGIFFEGKNLLTQSESELQKSRGKDISMIFQDPMSALNPCFNVGYQLIETLQAHQTGTKKELSEKACDLLDQVGIPAPKSRLKCYPHELSGGMAQRVMIAQALACKPKLLIADEPTTALDVTIQAQILRLLKSLQEKHNMGLVFITHDMGVVSQVSDRIMVMYAGQMIESGPTLEVIDSPFHPYSKGLLESLPGTHTVTKEKLTPISGVVPNLLDRPNGCYFHPRCPNFEDKCKEQAPTQFKKNQRMGRCHFPLNQSPRSS